MPAEFKQNIKQELMNNRTLILINTGILACCLSAANSSKLYYATML
ncbi:hypothetical protein VB638_12760 [Dolichospermum sp. UHCC 0684]|nr:hypothetical protein [Dolichospermum sp. UHCC 0684]